MLADEFEQAIEVERLLQKRRAAEVGGTRLIERREHDDRHVGQRRVFALPSSELPAVHDGHHQVEQDEVGRSPL